MTGLGKLAGNGVIGVLQAFITAGVSSVIVFLRPVVDESTVFLMVRLYQLLQEGMAPAT